MNASRELVPLFANDISTFCKKLRQQLAGAGVNPLPGHLALLNVIARSAGHRNFQALRATPGRAMPIADTPHNPTQTIVAPRDSMLSRTAARALTHFDTTGQLTRWPTQFAVQQIAIWGLWMRLPGKRELREREVNEYLAAYNRFGDPVTLRRELINARLLWRTPDGRVYRKVARRTPAEIRDFLHALALATRASYGARK
jgi:hypothetical protein